MTLAELLEKSRDIPGNSDVFAVPVADERNRAGATFEVVDVFFDLDNIDQTYILLRKNRPRRLFSRPHENDCFSPLV